MVSECFEYLRTFDAFILPWWLDTWGHPDHGGRPDLERRTQLAVLQLEVETRGPAIREAHHRTMCRLTESATTTPDEIFGIWQRLAAQADLLRARLACATDSRDIRQYVRKLGLGRFEDVCVVPFQLNEWPFGWHWESTRPTWAT